MTTPTYLALDLETTGLDPTRDRIIEAAAIVLGGDFETLVEWSSCIIANAPAVGGASDFVKSMHVASGLFRQVGADVVLNPDAGNWIDLSVAEYMLCQIAAKFPEKPILLGHSVHFDRRFCEHWMPHLHAMLHHRHIEARTLVEALRITEPEKKPHRALADARHSVEVARRARAL